METTVQANPRVYVADLAAYNNGRLHGIWIDLDDDATVETVSEQIQAMLKTSPEPHAEEYAFHDYEEFGSYNKEHASLETVVAIAESIRKHGEVFAEYLTHTGYDDPEEAERHFEEAYSGEWDNEKAFGENLFEELGYEKEVPEHLRYYIDTDAWTRDLFLSGDYFGVRCDGATHVFRSI